MDTIPEKMPPGQVMELVERSEAQIAAGQTVPLEPVLHRLRASIARVQGKQPANSNSHYDCGSQLSNRGNRQYEMKLLYWMAAASEGRQPLSITAKMRIAVGNRSLAVAAPPLTTGERALGAPGSR